VVFTDLTMPRMNGYELLRMIRTAADSGIQSLPVIVVTGVDDSEVAQVRALELGATDFITKPFTKVDLLARARAHATYQRITQQLRAQSTLDPLTGLANKAGFLDRLQQDMAYARRHKMAVTLACLEIADFRTVFLKHGKVAAESLLTQAARLLRASIRKEDTAGRVGIGAFALALPGGEPAGVERSVSRVCASITLEAQQVFGGETVLALKTAVLPLEADSGVTPADALEQCQARLEFVGEPASAAATPAHTASVAPSAPVAPPVPAAPVAVEPAVAVETPQPVRLDPLLDQIDQGNSQPAIERMPQLLRRLLPLLKLLNPTQRATLVRFLQQ